jgi:hypothetical protein
MPGQPKASELAAHAGAIMAARHKLATTVRAAAEHGRAQAEVQANDNTEHGNQG